MSLEWIGKKFIGQIEHTLEGFVWKGEDRANCRCPVCGDSKVKKNKKRGWWLLKNGEWVYKCYNCGYFAGLPTFLKRYHNQLYHDYLVEKMGDNYRVPTPKAIPKPEPVIVKPNGLENLVRLDRFPKSNMFVQYVSNRLIPRSKWNLIYACPTEFEAWYEKVNGNELPEWESDPRIIIPSFNSDGNVMMYSCRSIVEKPSIRYLIIKVRSDGLKLFGLERVNTKQTHLVLEGQLDSLFFDNALAMVGSDFPEKELNKRTAIVVYDNEPRNAEIVTKMQKALNHGFKVCVWPKSMRGKDVNEMVQNGHSAEEIFSTVLKNSAYGLQCKLMIAQWLKN